MGLYINLFMVTSAACKSLKWDRFGCHFYNSVEFYRFQCQLLILQVPMPTSTLQVPLPTNRIQSALAANQLSHANQRFMKGSIVQLKEGESKSVQSNVQ